MDTERRVELILKEPTEEVVTEEDLRKLLETNERPVAYDGYEPSGLAHIGTALLRSIKLEDMLEAGCRFKLLVADWFAWINNKMGGDLEKIRKVGEYLVEVWKALGVDTDKVDVVWTSDVVKDSDYWKLVIDVAKVTTVKRMIRASTVMGREEGEMQYAAQIFYPAMQTADPFYLGVDICQLGMDQRKCTILSREIGPRIGKWKTVSVHHHLLIGLQGPGKMGNPVESKMSKSKPSTCIFVHDTEEEIRKKILNAFCPEKVVDSNPVLEICRYIIFRKTKSLNIERPSKYGGDVEFWSYKELEDSYRKGELHPKDLKEAVARELEKLIKPVREYFEKNRKARELYETVKSFHVTR